MALIIITIPPLSVTLVKLCSKIDNISIFRFVIKHTTEKQKMSKCGDLILFKLVIKTFGLKTSYLLVTDGLNQL